MKYALPLFVVMLILCLAEMPYGYYTLTRFVAMVIFTCLAYINKEDKTLYVIFAASALLFQPFIKLALGRTIWNIIDVGEAMLLSWYWYKKHFKSTI